MTQSKTKRIIAIVLAVLSVVMIALGAVNMPKRDNEVGQEILKDLRIRTLLDATGAGDSYDAAFICGLAEGKTLKGAAQMGAAAGALNAAAFGPMEGNISRATVEKMIADNEEAAK